MGKGGIRQSIICSGVLLFLLVAASGLHAQAITAYPLQDASGAVINCTPPDDYELLTDGNGNVHIVWGQSGYIYYGRLAYNPASGQYFVTGKEYTNVNIYLDGVSTWFSQPRAAVRRDGQTVHIVWGDTLKHAWRTPQGVWSKETVRTVSGIQICRSPSVVVEDNETVHVLYAYYDGSNGYDPTHLIYQRKPAGGSWSGYMEIDYTGYLQGAEWRNPVMALDAQGGIHATWSNQIYWMTPDGGAARYRYAPAGSGLEAATTVIIPRANGVLMSGVGNIFVDPFGRVHRTVCSSDSSIDYTSKPSGASGSWAAPTRASIGLLSTPEDSWSSLTTDSCGRVLVAFPDGPSEYNYPNIYLSILELGAWTKHTISTTAGLDFFRLPALVSAGGTLFLMWRQSSGQIYLATAPDSCGSLTITSPMGGETWRVGESRDIIWSSTGTVGLVNIDYSTDNGTSWNSIVRNTANDGLHPWTVPNTPSATCLVRVREVDGSPSGTSRAVFTIAIAENVSAPIMPSGPAFGTTSTSFFFSTGGSISSLGHLVQYLFDWGDGSTSGWLPLGTISASHGWATTGTYNVRAMARCATDTSNVSLWSDVHVFSVVIPTTNKATCDFNGDDLSDIAVWRPGNGYWFILGQGLTQWGMAGDVPVPGDYNGDGRTDLAVWRPSDGHWFIQGQGYSQFGENGDVPVSGDYNGDGRTDKAVWRPASGTWFINYQTGANHISQWGQVGDIPVPGDYNGDGKTDIAVWRPSNRCWYILGQGITEWGTNGDVPVPADYNGDGRTDMAVWRPSNGYWFVMGQGMYQWGTIGDNPLCGDYNGDGRAEMTVWRPSNGYWFILGQANIQWGMNGDVPLD